MNKCGREMHCMQACLWKPAKPVASYVKMWFLFSCIVQLLQ